MKEIITSKQLARKIFESLKEMPWLKINGYSAYYLFELSDGSDRDYIILESARSEPFDLFVNDVKALVNIMKTSPRAREIYAYRINCEENILKIPLINKMTGAFEWKPVQKEDKTKINGKSLRKPNHKYYFHYAK
jgi:hypothetical protein